ncbi:MAG: hypothetical protein K2M06_04040 [Muribaculaceae bacterium]|nr:hypothetical protein [Muribaculaceae bacterium]
MDASELSSQYFAETVRKNFRKLFAEQQKISGNRIYRYPAKTLDGRPRSRSHVLEKSLRNPDYTIRHVEFGLSARVNYPIYIRFLDMRKYGNHRIYNRPVWGIMFSQTIKDLRWAFSDWLREKFRDEIRECFF